MKTNKLSREEIINRLSEATANLFSSAGTTLADAVDYIRFNQDYYISQELEIKETENQLSLSGKVSTMAEELAVLNPELVQANLTHITEDGKKRLLISGEKITLKLSKKGYLYSMLLGEYIKGGLREAVFNYLRTNADIKRYKGKMGKYEVEGIKWNDTILYLLINISTNRVEFVINKDRYNQMLSKMEIQHKREDLQYSPKIIRTNSVVQDESRDWSKGIAFGSMYDGYILDQLDILQEFIESIDSYEPDIKDKLRELYELISNKL